MLLDWAPLRPPPPQLNVASGIQDFLICIEMFFAALAHAYAFPPRDYMDPNHPRKSFFSNVKHMFDLRDVMDDTWMVRGTAPIPVIVWVLSRG